MNATSAANSDGSDPSSRHASMMGSGGGAALMTRIRLEGCEKKSSVMRETAAQRGLSEPPFVQLPIDVRSHEPGFRSYKVPRCFVFCVSSCRVRSGS